MSAPGDRPLRTIPGPAWRTSECRSCAARIVWAHSEAGARMPINPDPVPGGNLVVVGTKGGELLVHVERQAELFPAEGPRYVSHFATCPQADRWRQR